MVMGRSGYAAAAVVGTSCAAPSKSTVSKDFEILIELLLC
jgi:hypothetical protein